MDVKDLKREDVIYLLKQIWHYPRKLENFGDDEFFDQGRKIDVIFSRGYDNPEYTTILFCITGSPNKLFGWIAKSTIPCLACQKYHVTEVHSNRGTFYFSLDALYDIKPLGRSSKMQPFCPSNKKWISHEAFKRWEIVHNKRKNRVMGLTEETKQQASVVFPEEE